MDDLNLWTAKDTGPMNGERASQVADGSVSMDRCRCCPYGYHIDLDFVRYCEILNNGQYLQRLKQLHRNRRKQRKSMEVILGVAQPKSGPGENGPGLQDAMVEFDEVFQKSGQDPQFPSLDLSGGISDSDAPSPGIGQETRSMSLEVPRSRSDSASSGSVVSFAVADGGTATDIMLPSQQMADAMAVLASSMKGKDRSSSAAGNQSTGLDAAVLQSIRDQMALSLRRVKELEEHTKAVPVLQVKLSVLKEEKRLLALQLKAKSSVGNTVPTRSIGVGDFPVFEDEMTFAERERRLDELGVYATLGRRPRGKFSFADGCIGCHLRSRSVSPGRKTTVNPEEFHSFFLFHGPKSPVAVPAPGQMKSLSTRTVGVGRKCTTRDVGVGHITTTMKDVGVSCYPEEPAPSTAVLTRDVGVGAGVSPVLHSVGVNTLQPVRRHLSVTLSKAIDVEPKMCAECERTRSRKTQSRSTCTDSPSQSVAPVKQYCDCGSDTSDLARSCNVSVQSVPDVRGFASQTVSMNMKHANVGTDIKARDASVSAITTVREFGVGGNSIDCPKCASRNLRSVGVGQCGVKDELLCDRCASSEAAAAKMRSVGCGSHCVNDRIFCDRCSRVSTASIAVSTDGLPEAKPTLDSSQSGVNVCDKCNKTIRSVATGVVQPTKRSFGSGGMEWLRTWQLPEGASRVEKKAMTDASGRQVGRREKGLKVAAVGKKSGNVDVKRDESSSGSSSSSSSSSGESPDEGSYDGLCGKIIHSCKDDEAIRRGLPGAAMFQPLQDVPRVTFSMSPELEKACRVVGDHMTSSNQVVLKDYNASLKVIQQEWFGTSSQKNADPQHVEGFLDALEDISPQLLNKIVNICDANGNTAMHYAISHANFDAVGILLDSKVCDVNKTNKAGYTSVMLASLAKQKDDSHNSVLQRLFRLGDVNIKATQHGQTALMLAVSRGRSDVVKMLLDAGADVNIKDKDGSTALMCASEHGHMNIVKVLLAHPDCDPSIMDNDGSTALSIAMEAGYKDVGVLIYAHTSFSRGSSPYASLKLKRRGTSTPTRLTSTPPPRTPPPSSPAWSRKSSAALMP